MSATIDQIRAAIAAAQTDGWRANRDTIEASIFNQLLGWMNSAAQDPKRKAAGEYCLETVLHLAENEAILAKKEKAISRGIPVRVVEIDENGEVIQ